MDPKKKKKKKKRKEKKKKKKLPEEARIGGKRDRAGSLLSPGSWHVIAYVALDLELLLFVQLACILYIRKPSALSLEEFDVGRQRRHWWAQASDKQNVLISAQEATGLLWLWSQGLGPTQVSYNRHLNDTRQNKLLPLWFTPIAPEGSRLTHNVFLFSFDHCMYPTLSSLRKQHN